MAIRQLDRTPTPALFTRAVVIAIFVAVLLTLMRLPTVTNDAPRENYLSLLGLVLPEQTWSNSLVLTLGMVGFLVGTLLWVMSPRATLGAAIAVVGLILVGSFRVENELYARHQLFQPVAALAILAGGTALRRGKLDLPAWIWTAVACAIGWGYTLSGLEKLSASGVGWADGTALRVWLAAFAPDKPVASWLIGTPWAANLGQVIVLIAETTAVFGLGFRKTRLLVALVLLSFHLSMEWWMGLAFYPTEVILVALCVGVFLRGPRRRDDSPQTPDRGSITLRG